jgi:hypothetical protein
MPDPKLPSVCGHAGTMVVRYSSHDSEILHTICSSCHSKGLYFAQPTELPEIQIDGGSAFVEIWL